MVQVTIAYVALGFGVLLIIAGGLSATRRDTPALLEPAHRLLIWGGIIGMMMFLIALSTWLRRSLWVP
jgi:hypothetical protein